MDMSNKSKYIIIGEKFWISKYDVLNHPFELHVLNIETNNVEIYKWKEISDFFDKEGIDTKPLFNYFDSLYEKFIIIKESITNEQEFIEWERKQCIETESTH
jgi:hypothetical protein